MTADQLLKLNIDVSWLVPLRAVFDKYAINTPQRQACFIGQCAHESSNFKVLVENLNYSIQAAARTWPSHFLISDSSINSAWYDRQPEHLANRVYANRMGNGAEASGDGWKYRGRGLIQLTGHDAYSSCGEEINVNLVDDPDKVITPEYAALTAGWFWNLKGLNVLADAGEYTQMTKRINGGVIGLTDRIALINKALEVLK